MFSKTNLSLVVSVVVFLAVVVIAAVVFFDGDDQVSADEDNSGINYCVQHLSPVGSGEAPSEPVCFDNWSDAALYESGGEVVLPRDVTEREFTEAMDIFYFGEVVTAFED